MNSYSADDISKAEGLQFLAVRHFLADVREGNITTDILLPVYKRIDDYILGRVTKNFLVRCQTSLIIQIYDYVCSLHEEWTFLRLSRWTKVKGLYIITRYIPFLVLIADLYLYFAPNETPDRCRMVISIYACLTVISVLCSELFFVLRTYALWNNNQIVLTAILSTLFAVAVASLIADVLSVGNSHVTISMIPTITGCYRTSHGFQGSIPFLLLFAFQLGLVSLTIIRAVQNWRVFNSPLYEVVVKHNLFYYTCGLLLSAINVLMQTLFSQTAYRLVGEVLQYFVLAILATRMHRNLWQIDRQARDSVTDAYSTS